ncbi:MAG TPA: hypothetical protein VFS83_15240 [Ktedonobacterales bacterium]|nr:hypothetical protein [Ktedonobacterales bacterium]
MTQESPTSDREGALESENSSIMAVGAPARIVAGKRTLPAGSSDKYPLPGRWPQPEAWLEPADTPEPEVEPQRPVAPMRPVAPSRPVEPAIEPPVMIEIEIGSRPSAVKRSDWLEAPDYWLADHQSVPRPPTRPIPRPKRFVRMSRRRSATLLFVAVVGITVVGAGMVFAGHLTYDYFNTPLALPTAHPATATATDIPATATPTDIPVTVTATDATDGQGTATPAITPDTTPDITPVIPIP